MAHRLGFAVRRRRRTWRCCDCGSSCSTETSSGERTNLL